MHDLIASCGSPLLGGPMIGLSASIVLLTHGRVMFVMAGAMAVHFVLSRMIRRRGHPLFDSKFHLPMAKAVDRKVVLGAAAFGWGLGGFCPGPALVTLGSGALSAVVFVGTMALGMAIHHSLHAAAR